MSKDAPDADDDLADVYADEVFRCPMGHNLRQREWAERNGACLIDGRCPDTCAVKNRNANHLTQGDLA